MRENRRYLRFVHRASINITFATGETMKAYTRNMSDGGLLIQCPNPPEIKVGDLAEVIVLGIQDAVSRPVKIIRIDSEEILAVEYNLT